MNFETYRIFYYTARYKNITGAAKALFLTQPTVSHAIAGLEKELGCQLFIRSKKGVQMTPEAELLYRHLSKAFQHVEDGEQSLRDHLSLSEGQIRIGASETTLHYFLLPYLEQFRAAYPHIRLKISNTTTPAALHALREHAIDFAVIIAPVADDSIEIHELLEIRDDLKGTIDAMLFSKNPRELNSLFDEALQELLDYQQEIKKKVCGKNV